MSDSVHSFRTFLVKVTDGRVRLLGRIIGNGTTLNTEAYHHNAWHDRPQLMSWLEGQNPYMGEEIDESEVPRYMKMIDDQIASAGEQPG